MVRVRVIGWFYRPASPAAWLVASLLAAFCVTVFVAVDRHAHSVSDTLYGIFPYWSAAFLLWNWAAGRSQTR